jgi:hypothetical protein
MRRITPAGTRLLVQIYSQKLSSLFTNPARAIYSMATCRSVMHEQKKSQGER